ncbi:MAG: VanZ family protein [Bacteroides sp.]|nr:VanZ family protein [Bacteroides sp.]
MTQYIKNYPISLLIVIIIGYLSFFSPPKTDLNEIPYLDKVVHICMYGGLSTLLWIEYLLRHRTPDMRHLVAGAIISPIVMSGGIEILQTTCTSTRSGDWLDFIANCTGVIIASLLGHYLWRPFIQKHFPSSKK